VADYDYARVATPPARGGEDDRDGVDDGDGRSEAS